jgi:hypothetical protein
MLGNFGGVIEGGIVLEGVKSGERSLKLQLVDQ